MRKRIEFGILLCMMCLTLFFLIHQWRELLSFSKQVGLRYEAGTLSGEQIEQYNKRQIENAKKTEGMQQTEITAWKMEKGQEVSWNGTGRQTKGIVITVYGNMARVLPFSMKYGGFTFPEDSVGCVISRGLAWKLFGAEDVVGNVVQYEGREFLIRGVLDMEESVLAIYQTKKQEAMPYVEVWAKSEPPAARLEQIKSGLGISEASYEFAGSFCFTRDFIPAQWSDFSFWSDKWHEILEDIQGRGQFPGIYWEQEVIGRVEGIAAGAVALIVIFVRMSKAEYERTERTIAKK